MAKKGLRSDLLLLEGRDFSSLDGKGYLVVVDSSGKSFGLGIVNQPLAGMKNVRYIPLEKLKFDGVGYVRMEELDEHARGLTSEVYKILRMMRTGGKSLDVYLTDKEREGKRISLDKVSSAKLNYE